MLTRSFKLGAIFGIEIRLDYSWFIILILITSTFAIGTFAFEFPHWPTPLHWIFGMLTAILFFGSVLIHEMAHSLYARHQGVPVKNITLFIFGGAAQIADEPKRAEDEFIMAILGPASSVVLCFMMIVIWRLSFKFHWPIVSTIARNLAMINLVLAIFNLIPGFPLDGGRILRSIIWGITKNLRRATQIATLSGRVFGFFFIILGVLIIFHAGSLLEGFWLSIIGWFLLNAATRSYQQMMIREILKQYSIQDVMTTAYYRVPPALTIAQLVKGPILPSGQQVFPVVLGDQLLGLANIEQIRKTPKTQWEHTSLDSIMQPLEQQENVDLHASVFSVLQKFAAKRINQIPVVENGTFVGLASKQRIINLIQMRNSLKI